MMFYHGAVLGTRDWKMKKHFLRSWSCSSRPTNKDSAMGYAAAQAEAKCCGDPKAGCSSSAWLSQEGSPEVTSDPGVKG